MTAAIKSRRHDEARAPITLEAARGKPRGLDKESAADRGIGGAQKQSSFDISSYATGRSIVNTRADRDRWLKHLVASTLGGGELRLAISLATVFWNGPGGMCPSYDEIAENLVASRRTVIRQMKSLVEAGVIGVRKSRGRKPSTYFLVFNGDT